MSARGWLAGGGASHSPAHAPVDGGPGRNLLMTFENLSAPAESAPRLNAGSPPFKRSNLAQAVFDIAALIFIALFLALTAAGIGVALFILFFVGVR